VAVVEVEVGLDNQQQVQVVQVVAVLVQPMELQHLELQILVEAVVVEDILAILVVLEALVL
jgi:hypothetical protein